jgi:hypothetical protein
MKNWLQETHGAGFELLRHFLRRFFDSDLTMASGYMTGVLVGALPLCFQWFFLLIVPFRGKYAQLSALSTPGPYRAAVRADELWLITLMMSVVGLLTAIKWQSLFPDLRDYRALGTLPLYPRQIFGAKLLALLLVAAAALTTINFLPCAGFPVISDSRWAIHSSLSARILGQAAASLAASCFFFFGLVALQGVLLNLFTPRAFRWLTGNLQGLLVAVMLVLIVASFSIQPEITSELTRPEWARWLPPIWFLGLYQVLVGDPEPAMRALAYRAVIALGVVIALTFATYLVSYQRRRILLVEGVRLSASGRSLSGIFLGWFVTDPREQAVWAFMLKTLARSSYHRMILVGYVGLAFALVVTGPRSIATSFVYFHLITLLFFLVGSRHVFSIPTELKANWIFQMTEGEGRGMWLRALDRFILFSGTTLIFLMPLPLEIHVLGWRGLAEAALLAAMGLLAYELSFSSWEKLPFTCSRLPGKAPVWMMMAFFGLIALVSLLHGILLAILYNWIALVISIVVLLAFCAHLRRSRRQGWEGRRLKYDEVPEPAVHSLNLLR